MVHWFAHMLCATVLAVGLVAGEGTAAAAGPAAVEVVIAGAEGARLERQGEDGAWQTVCVAPCDRSVSTDLELRIAGNGIKPSRPFRLTREHGDRVLLEVSPATSGGTAGGIVLVAIGPAAVAAGFLLALASLSTTLGDAPQNDSRYDGARTEGKIGGALMIGGLIATAIGVPAGILTIVGNSRSRVREESYGPGLPKSAPDEGSGARLPRAAGPRAMMLPLFSVTF